MAGDAEQASAVETINDCMVAALGRPGRGSLMILRPPLGPLDPERALRLAAWLVVLADPFGTRFPVVLNAVRST